MPASPRRLRIVLLGAGNEQRHQRAEVLCEGLDADGHTVIRCDLPGDPARPGAWVRRFGRTRPVTGPDVVVVVGQGRQLDVHLARARWPRSRIVLDRIGSEGPSRLERAAIRRADLVAVRTQAAAQWHDIDAHKVVVVPDGASQGWFAAADRRRRHPSRHEVGPMRVIFFGDYEPVDGSAVIGRTIERLAEHYIEWTMVGTGPDRAATEAATDGRGKVTWIDAVPRAELPALVAEHDVCLGTFGSQPVAEAVVPNRVLQGAAAGCAVVTSSTPGQREALGGAALFVPPGKPDLLAATIAALASDPRELARYREAATLHATRSCTPAAVTAQLAALLAEGPTVPF